MDMKTCLKCGIEKEIRHFRKSKIGFLGVISVCKKCCEKNAKHLSTLYIEISKNRPKDKKILYPWINTLNHIKQRCSNPNCECYNSYGGKGILCLITIAELKVIWFRDRAYEMVCPSIDRIDNDGNYTFENCRYIERRENSLKSNKKDYIYNPSFLGYEHTIIT
jgi:hypothetical protein